MLQIRTYGPDDVDKILRFCYPGINARASFAPLEKADITIPRLRHSFEEAQTKYKLESGIKLYSSFKEYLNRLKTYLPVNIVEDGIYVNLFFNREYLSTLTRSIAMLE